jgi:hypothetical protein
MTAGSVCPALMQVVRILIAASMKEVHVSVQHAPSQQDGFGQHSLPHIVPATGHPARAKMRYAIVQKKAANLDF